MGVLLGEPTGPVVEHFMVQHSANEPTTSSTRDQ
jgi:hypothetical protein